MLTKKSKNLLILLLSFVVVLSTCFCCIFSFTNYAKADEVYTIDYSKITTTKDLIKDYRGGTKFTPGDWQIIETDLSSSPLVSNFSLKIGVYLNENWAGNPALWGPSLLAFRFFGTTASSWTEGSSTHIGDYATNGFLLSFESVNAIANINYKGTEVNRLVNKTEGISAIVASNFFILEVGSYDVGDGTSVIYGKIDDLIFAYATFETGTFTFGNYVSIGAASARATIEDSTKTTTVKVPYEDINVIPYDTISVFDVVDDFNAGEDIKVEGLNTIDLSTKITSVSNIALKTRIYTGNMQNMFNQRYFHFFAQDGSAGVPMVGVADSTGVLVIFYNDAFSVEFIGGDSYFSDSSAEWVLIDELLNIDAQREYGVLEVASNTYVDLEVGTFTVDDTYDAVYVKVNGYIIKLLYYVKGTFDYGDNFTAKVDNAENFAELESSTASICKIIYNESQDGYMIGSQKVFAGEEVTVKLIPNTGYKVQSLLLNGSAVDINDIEYNYGALNIGEYTFTASVRTEISATFVIDNNIELDVYDYMDISGSPRLDILNTTTIYSFGQMPKTTNVVFKMIFNPGFGLDSASGAQRQLGFLEDAGSPLWSTQGFETSFYWQNSENFQFKGWGHANVVWANSNEAYLTPGVEALIEMGHIDIDDVYSLVFVKVDNRITICEKYEKVGYSIGTGVGGLYIDSVEDIDEGSIYVKTTYDYNYAELTNEELKEAFNLVKNYIVLDKPLEILAGTGYDIKKVKLIDSSTSQVIQEFTGNEITKDGAIYSVVPQYLGTGDAEVLVDIEYEKTEINVNFDYETEKITVLSPDKVYLRDDYNVQFVTSEGCVLDSIIINNVDVTNEVSLIDGVYNVKALFVESDLNIVITVKTQNYNVSATLKNGCVGANIKINGQVIDIISIEANSTVRFEVGLDDGYIAIKVTLNGEDVYLDSEGCFVVEKVQNDLVLEVETVEEVVSKPQEDTSFFGMILLFFRRIWEFILSIFA